MQNSRMLHLVSLTTFLLFCLSCREPMGEQQGTTPSEGTVPNSQKEDMEKAEPIKIAPLKNNSTPSKSKNGQKSRSRDTLTPKLALASENFLSRKPSGYLIAPAVLISPVEG